MDTTAATRHALKQRRDDLYETPIEAVRALLTVESFQSGRVWEPACGRGAIAEPLRRAGCDVLATDLVDYNYGSPRIDFLLETNGHGCSTIVTNPPFKLADEFVRHALDLCPRVVMLLRLAYLESEGRSDLLDDGRLARVHVFRNRLPMMHRDGWEGPKAPSSTAFAWFVWQRGWNQPARINRISWENDNGGSSVQKRPRRTRSSNPLAVG